MRTMNRNTFTELEIIHGDIIHYEADDEYTLVVFDDDFYLYFDWVIFTAEIDCSNKPPVDVAENPDYEMFLLTGIKPKDVEKWVNEIQATYQQ